MATHSSTIAWRIPWTEEPGGLQSMGPKRIRHDLATETTAQKTQPCCTQVSPKQDECVYFLSPLFSSQCHVHL